MAWSERTRAAASPRKTALAALQGPLAWCLLASAPADTVAQYAGRPDAWTRTRAPARRPAASRRPAISVARRRAASACAGAAMAASVPSSPNTSPYHSIRDLLNSPERSRLDTFGWWLQSDQAGLARIPSVAVQPSGLPLLYVRVGHFSKTVSLQSRSTIGSVAIAFLGNVVLLSFEDDTSCSTTAGRASGPRVSTWK